MEKSESEIEKFECKIERDGCGLIKNLNYEFDNLGFVNYKKLIPREFLFPNRQHFQSKKLQVPDSIDGLADKELLVGLQGYKMVAFLRGFKKVKHKIVSASSESVTIETKIIWIPNYETNFQEVSYTALATASLSNTYNFAQYYLAEIAQNRGECRAIRGFLRIPILASDELGPQKPEEENVVNKMQPGGPHATLQKKLDEKNIKWDKFKSFCIGKNVDNAEKWEDILSVDPGQVLNLLNLMNQKKDQKELDLK